MATTTSRKTKGASYEQVWEALKETDRLQKENARQIRNLQAEMKKETDEVKRQQKETARQLGRFGNSFGDLLESIVLPNLLRKFQELGLIFHSAHKDLITKDENYKYLAEVDITMSNGDRMMLVEVKSRPTIKDVTVHVERIKKIRASAHLRNENRLYMGAIAGVVIRDNVKQFAFKSGFYVVEPSGDTFNITAPERPGEW